MRNLSNVALFKLVWVAAVVGASRSSLWLGPLATLVFLFVHLRMIPSRDERPRELLYIVAVGIFGTAADTTLALLGATAYPTSVAWTFPVVPPWIISLWVAFAMLPRFALHWLSGKTTLAILFGAVCGPLSYFGGTRLGAVAVPESSLLTFGALSIEYALVTPLLLLLAPSAGDTRPAEAEASETIAAA